MWSRSAAGRPDACGADHEPAPRVRRLSPSRHARRRPDPHGVRPPEACGQTWTARSADGAGRAVGEKPLTTSQTPTENSQVAIGRASSSATGDTWSHTPNIVASDEASSSGAPTSPTAGITRGTRPDRYSTEPSRNAL